MPGERCHEQTARDKVSDDDAHKSLKQGSSVTFAYAAMCALTASHAIAVDDADDSDYGSVFGDDDLITVNELLVRAPEKGLVRIPVYRAARSHAEDVSMACTFVRGMAPIDDLGLDPQKSVDLAMLHDESGFQNRGNTVTCDDSAQRDSPGRQRYATPQLAPNSDDADSRSPLERFRTAPRKPLSVTDLISPAWCELQYWYALTTHGRKRRTPAMKQGSVVHKVLEEQVHQTVSVDVQTKEDHWALKFWNVIQGLRTLRATGMTRELDVWGVLDGVLVQGVIDELSYTCADPELEAKLVAAKVDTQPEKRLPPDQTQISNYFTAGVAPADDTSSTPAPIVYLTDVKTRVRSSLPKGASLRPTHMQLMLYRRLLASLADNVTDPALLFSRHTLRPTHAFSDSLVAELGNLDLNLTQSATQTTLAPVESTADVLSELLAHNSLASLWTLVQREFRLTFPRGGRSIGTVLRAEYRAQHDGAVLGARSFAHDERQLDAYLSDGLRWWRGERTPRGVEIEEAFKCASCEFADGCTWRLGRVDEATERARARARVVRAASSSAGQNDACRS